MQHDCDFSIRIRHAIPDDVAPLVELAVRTYEQTFAAVNTAENMRAYLDSAFTVPQFQMELTDPRAIFLVAECDRRLCAYSKLLAHQAPECVPGEAPVELVRFYLDGEWHGSGLARKLMDVCLSEAKDRGYRTMYLGVWEKNFRAQAFYRKYNFTLVGEHIFQMGNDPQVDWWMVRSI